MINRLLADQKLMAFFGALILGIGGWAKDLTSWSDAFAVDHVAGFLAIVGGIFLANAAKSVWIPGGAGNGND